MVSPGKRQLSNAEWYYLVAFVAAILSLFVTLAGVAASKGQEGTPWAFLCRGALDVLALMLMPGVTLLLTRRHWPPSIAIIGCVVASAYCVFLLVFNTRFGQ